MSFTLSHQASQLRFFRVVLFSLVVLNPIVYSLKLFDSFNLPKVALGVLGATILGVALSYWSFRSESIRFPKQPALLLFLGFWLWMGLLIIKGINPADGFVEWVRYGSYLFVILAVVYSINDSIRLRWLFRLLAGVGGGVAAWGMAQYFGLPLAVIPGNFEAISTFGHQNFAAEAILLMLPCAIALIVTEKNWSLRGLWGVCLVFMGMHLMVSQCRAAWLGSLIATAAVVCLTVIAFLKKSNPQRLKILKNVVMVSVILMVLGVALLLVSPFKNRFLSTFNPQDGTAKMRLQAWSATLRMVGDYPLLGVGPGNYKQNIPHYRIPEEMEFSGVHSILNKAHNEYLEILSELGPVGFLLFLSLMGAAFYHGWKGFQLRENLTEHIFILGSFWALVASMVNACFAFNLSNGGSALLFWVHWAVLAGIVLPQWGGELQEAVPSQKPAKDTSHSKKKNKGNQGKGKLPKHHSHEQRKAKGQDHGFYYVWKGGLLRHWVMVGVVVFCLVSVFWYSKMLVADVYLQRGKTMEKAERFQHSSYWYQKAVDWYSYHYLAYYYFAYSLGNINQYQAALSATQRCLTLNPTYRNAAFNLGVLYEHLQNDQGALKAYQRTLELDPRFYSALNNLNVLYQRMDDYQAAADIVQKALKYYPHSPDAHSNLGVIYYLTQDYDAAIVEFQKALDEQWRINFQPTDINYFIRVGKVEGRVAAHDAQGAMIGTWSDWGEYHFSDDSNTPPVLKNPPTLLNLVHNLGDNSYSIELDPLEDVRTWTIQYRIRGNVTSYRHATHELVYAKAYNNMGASYEKKEDYEKAELYYLKAIKYEPTYTTPYSQLSKLFVNVLGRYKDAVPLMEKYIELDPKSQKAQEFRGLLEQIKNSSK